MFINLKNLDKDFLQFCVIFFKYAYIIEAVLLFLEKIICDGFYLFWNATTLQSKLHFFFAGWDVPRLAFPGCYINSVFVGLQLTELD